MHRFILLLAVMIGVGASQDAMAAPILGGSLRVGQPAVTEVYYYHGGYYPYRYHGHYYRHRNYRNGRYYYY